MKFLSLDQASARNLLIALPLLRYRVAVEKSKEVFGDEWIPCLLHLLSSENGQIGPSTN